MALIRELWHWSDQWKLNWLETAKLFYSKKSTLHSNGFCEFLYFHV